MFPAIPTSCAAPTESNQFFCTGELIAISTAGLTVRTARGLFGARRALGCLVEPVIGDTVLAAGEDGGSIYVIAVLERGCEQPVTLVVDRDLHLRTAGHLALHADGGIHLATPANAVVAADELTVRGRRTAVLFERFDAIGAEVHSAVGRVRLLAQALESVVDRVLMAAKTSMRMVEGADQSRCGSSDHRATGTVKVHGRNVVTTASEVVKADGAQIHLG